MIDLSTDLIDRLAADLCDRAARPARIAYDPAAWNEAGQHTLPSGRGTRQDYWRRHAAEVVSWVLTHVIPTADWEIDVEWCHFYGGDHPDAAAGVIVTDDEAAAGEAVQWYQPPAGHASRTVARGPWTVEVPW